MWVVIYITIVLVFFCLLMISYFCHRLSRVYKVCSIFVNVNLKNLICVLMLLSHCALDLVKGLTLHVLNLPLFMVTHSSGSANVVILVFISQLVDSFRCSYDSAKSSFFRAFNAIYSKVGRTASEETVIALLRSKCLPVLLYATEACPLLVRDQRSLEFTVTRVFMKIFRTGSSTIITECQRNFNFLSIQRQLLIRTAKFLQAFAASENHICLLFNSNVYHQLNTILSSASVTSTGQLINVMYNQLYCTQWACLILSLGCVRTWTNAAMYIMFIFNCNFVHYFFTYFRVFFIMLSVDE